MSCCGACGGQDKNEKKGSSFFIQNKFHIDAGFKQVHLNLMCSTHSKNDTHTEFIAYQKVKKNSLFVAIKGKNKDGHDYVKNALKKGAVKAIVSRKLKFINQNKQIKVSNTHNILKSIGYNTRNFSNSKVIGITGTAGKTTLKNLLNFVLLKYGKTQMTI